MSDYTAVGSIGRNADRKLTDWPGTLLFIGFWVFMFILLGSAAKSSKAHQMLYGTDFRGNVCGEGHLKDKNVLWYPIAFHVTEGFNYKFAAHMGLCSKSCKVSDVEPYDGYPTPITSGFYPSGDDSSVILHRCIPNFLGMKHQCNGTKKCLDELSNGKNAFLNKLGVGSIMFGIVQDLHSSYGMIIALVVIAIVLSYAWLYSMRVLVKPIAIGCAIGLLILMLVIGGLSIHAHNTNNNKDSESAKGFMALGIISFICSFFYFCFLLYVWKDLLLCCNIIIESSKVVLHIPQMVAVPAVATTMITCVGILSASMALFIYTAGDYETFHTKNPNTGVITDTKQFVGKDWRTSAQLYNLFMFLWTMGLFHAISMTTISMCCVQWYWSNPGDDKMVPNSPVLWGFKTVMIKHFGTMALGSMLIAIVQWCRVCLRLFEKRLQAITGNATAGKYLLCCAQCCLACFERLVKFLTEHAYVMTSMTGASLIPGAKTAMGLLASNLSVLGVNILGDVVITLGKLLLTALNMFFAFLWLQHSTNTSDSISKSNYIMLIVIVGLLTYFIASVFATVFSMCIDTVLISYCYDCEHNDGTSKPYYFPSSLKEHIGHAHRRGSSPPGPPGKSEAAPLI